MKLPIVEFRMGSLFCDAEWGTRAAFSKFPPCNRATGSAERDKKLIINIKLFWHISCVACIDILQGFYMAKRITSRDLGGACTWPLRIGSDSAGPYRASLSVAPPLRLVSLDMDDGASYQASGEVVAIATGEWAQALSGETLH